jgi:hypothetical protein
MEDEVKKFAEVHSTLAEALSEVAFTPTGLAELFATGARRNFAEYGSLVPLVALHSKTQTVMVTVMADTDKMAERFRFLVGVLVASVDPAYVTVVFEGWTKAYKADKRPPSLRRGQLGKMAEAGDETVGTALVSMTLARDGKGVAIYDRVVGDDFDRSVNEDPEGGVPEGVVAGWETGMDVGKPDVTLEELIQSVAAMGFITSGSIQVWDEEGAS